jgi:hypothetical protein
MQRTGRRGKPWRLLRMRAKNGPGTGDMPGPLVSELPTGGLARGHMPDQSKFLHSDYQLGCLFGAIPLGLRRRLRLGLRGVCEQPRPASRAAQPWSCSARGSISIGWYIGSCPVCGDAGGAIKPQSFPPSAIRAPPLLSLELSHTNPCDHAAAAHNRARLRPAVSPEEDGWR